MISVIIPIYNSENLLNDCIASIVNQDFSDWELLLIDDGSTDKSSDIAHQWAKRDNRVKYYRKENGGVSSARNYGLDRVNGEYILFVDSDDLCATTLLSALSTAMSKCCDLALCGIRRFRDGDNIEQSPLVSGKDIQALRGIDNIYQFMDQAGHLHQIGRAHV